LEMSGNGPAHNHTHSEYVKALFNCLGIGLEPGYQFLYANNPSFEVFEEWILENGEPDPEMIEMFNAALTGKDAERKREGTHLLSQSQQKQWDEEGYLVIPNAISKEQCQQTRDLICNFLEIDESDPNTWYKDHTSKQKIMVQLFRDPVLRANRLSPAIRSAYEQLWQQTNLMVSFDRVSFNPPETSTYKFPGPDLHWDVSLKTPIPFGTQGLLYLADTAENQGAFTLVPGFHKRVDRWMLELKAGENPRDQDLHALGSKPIAAKAGDFVIWNQALPHGSSPNTSTLPRFVQYINYQPLDADVQKEWI
jgi:ectoine hydroxylase-related dioxygenase (phytanoyl-CoA dioxygenase family)